MTEIIPFPTRLRVIASVQDDETSTKVADKLATLRSYILAMGPEACPLQIKKDFHVRQGKILEDWTNESVIELGHDVVIEMLESMTLHLMNEKRK